MVLTSSLLHIQTPANTTARGKSTGKTPWSVFARYVLHRVPVQNKQLAKVTSNMPIADTEVVTDFTRAKVKEGRLRCCLEKHIPRTFTIIEVNSRPALSIKGKLVLMIELIRSCVVCHIHPLTPKPMRLFRHQTGQDRHQAGLLYSHYDYQWESGDKARTARRRYNRLGTRLQLEWKNRLPSKQCFYCNVDTLYS